MFIHPSLTSPWDISRSFIRQISPSTSVVRVSRGKDGQTEATNPVLVNLLAVSDAPYFRGVSRGYFSLYKHAGERLTVEGDRAKVGQAAFDSKGGPRMTGGFKAKTRLNMCANVARPALSPKHRAGAAYRHVYASRASTVTARDRQ